MERVAAGARTSCVGVVDGEALLLDGVDEVDLRAGEIGGAHPVGDDGHATEVGHDVAVQPGGCAGLRYNLFFDDRTLDGDLTVDVNGVTLTVDRMSAPYIQGATIDFVDTIEKQGFTIDNPNATGSCACGDSFN